MDKSSRSSLFKTSLLAALLTSAFSAHAAGLGRLAVYSAIGQPLNAEVALTAANEELSSLSAKLASHTAFAEAGIDFAPALTGLRFTVVKMAGGQPVLKLSTSHPLNEPFLHFLVELNWATGRVVREYTFLLDPPESLQATKPATSVVVPSLPQPVPSVKPAAAPASMPDGAPSGAEEYRVKLGDTLGKIARENKVEHVSLDQMLVALFNSNREVFDGANMNRLRAGKILRLPDAAKAAQIDPGEARKIVISQAADFNAYRRRLAEAAATVPASEQAPQQHVEGRIESKTESKAPAAPSSDKLEVSRTEAAKESKAGKSRLEEDLIAREKALQEASARIAQLEKNLESLKQLAEIKSQAGAQLQQRNATAGDKPPVAPEPKPAAAQPAAPIAPPPAAEKPAAPAQPPAATPESKPEAAAPLAPAKPAFPPAAKKTAPPPPESSFIDDNPEIVFGGGGLIALLLGYFGYTTWRKKKSANTGSGSDSVAGVEAPVHAGAAVAGAASFDNGEVSILGDFSEGGVLTTEESVDPVAEADVLMAYGRDAQAEEILLEGLKADPTRSAIHVKLLELYAQRGDAARFESVGTELYALSGGEGGEWEKAVALARDSGVSHGVFASAVPSGKADDQMVEVVAQAPAAEPEAQPVVVSSTAIPSAPDEPAEPVAVHVAEDIGGGLDFDLDLGTTSMPAVATGSAGVAPAAAAADEVMSLDFDFDLGSSGTTAAAPADEPAPPAVVAEEPSEQGGVTDFAVDASQNASDVVELPVDEEPAAAGGDGLDFDLDLGSSSAAEAPPTDELPVGLSAGVADLGDGAFDLNLDSDIAGSGNAETPVGTQGQSGSNVDLALGGLGMDLDLGSGQPAMAPAVQSIELSGIDLSLDADVAPVVAAESVADASVMDFDLGSGEAGTSVEMAGQGEVDDPEVATKLELAQAYEEMGDREGARELLNEVLNEGSAAQRAAAQARLDQLLV